MLLVQPSYLSSLSVSGNPATAATSVTPGTSNAEGSWTQIIASTANDCHMLSITAGGLQTSGTNKNAAFDVGIGPATETEIIANVLCGKLPAQTICPGQWDFPIYIPAGTRITVRASTDDATAGTLGIRIYVHGGPSRPESVWVGGGVETIGTITNNVGVSIAAGASAVFSGSVGTGAGDWHSLGTTTKACQWWQLGFGVSNDTMTNGIYWCAEIGVGAAGGVLPIHRRNFVATNTELLYTTMRSPHCHMPVPAGATIYGRVASSQASPDTGSYMAAYGVY